MAYKAYGLATLYEILGERVVYRNLIPADKRIPPLSELWDGLGLDHRIPRKTEPDYARIVAEMMRQARTIDLPGVPIERLLFIGDTLLNDGTAFHNICAAGEWVGWGFIGRDTPDQPPQVKIEDGIYVTNRWSTLPDFLRFVEQNGVALDERTAAVIDIDKTAIGARGRNDGVINAARVEGVQRTVADLLGSDFNLDAFRVAYDELNQSPYYGLTADNQDYLAYICLILGAGLFELDALVDAVEDGTMQGFADFIGQVQHRREELGPSGLTSIHDDVWACVQAGDPTPFKAFRYNEYLTTAARFGDLAGASTEEVLKSRIAITQEVREAGLALQARGVLTFGLSDKPDEASVPSEAQASQGMRPLHRLETLVVGSV